MIIENNIIPYELKWPYKAVEGFDKPNGKFPNTLGNVALVDCHYISFNFVKMVEKAFKQMEDLSPIFYLLGRSYRDTILEYL